MLAFAAGLVAACGGAAATGGIPIGDLPADGAPAAATPVVATQAAAGSAVASGNPAGGDPTTPVACTLITAPEANTAVGENVADGKTALGENACIFSGQPSIGINFVMIRVNNPAEFLPGRAPIAGMFDRIAVSGVGDDAYYQKDYLPNNSGTTMTLWFKKGQTVISIYLIHPGTADGQLEAAEKTLALAAIGRM